MVQPNELRFNVRDSFEEFVTGISEIKGETAEDDRPIQEQALGMLDQLAMMEELMGTQTMDTLLMIEPREDAETEQPVVAPPPQYPSFQLD